jgi:hypothetical protein
MRHLGGWGRREHAPDEVGAPDGAAAEAVDGLPHRLERRRRVDLRSAADPDGGRSRRALGLGAHGRQQNAECESGGGLCGLGAARRVRSSRRAIGRREKRLWLYERVPAGERDVGRSSKEPLAGHGASTRVTERGARVGGAGVQEAGVALTVEHTKLVMML